MNLVFRNAGVDDSEEISRLLKITWLDTYSAFIPLPVIEGIAEQWHQPEFIKEQILKPTTIAWICVYENKLIGIFNAQPINDKDYYLNQLYVHPDFQAMGIGGMLFRLFIKKYDPGTVKLSVEEDNEKGKNFYLAKKFTVHSKVVEKFTGFDLNTVRMIWKKAQ